MLRDARILNVNDSLLGILESNLAQGPVYFNCYLNYSVEIEDPNILDTMTLNVKTKNMNRKLGTKDLAVIYRVYYKLIKTTIALKAINSSPKVVTVLMESNQEHSTTFVPRMLKWNEILSDESWKFESITESLLVQPLQPIRRSKDCLIFPNFCLEIIVVLPTKFLAML